MIVRLHRLIDLRHYAGPRQLVGGGGDLQGGAALLPRLPLPGHHVRVRAPQHRHRCQEILSRYELFYLPEIVTEKLQS